MANKTKPTEPTTDRKRPRRPEARAIQSTENIELKKAKEDIRNFIEDCAAELGARKDDERRDAGIFTNLSNRILFVDGKRGAGKTSIVLTVLEGIKGKIRDIDVEVLEWLDLDPIPKSVNILTAVLVRLSAKFSIKQDPAWKDAQADFTKFEFRTAASWDALLALADEADAAAREIRAQEKLRLWLVPELASLLNKHAKNTLFILPVDDFDLNPGQAAILLRTLRMLALPQLAFVVLGDFAIAQQVFELSVQRELAEAMGTQAEHLTAATKRTSGEIAANAMRKLLPAGQRIPLPPVRAKDALDVMPLFSSDENERFNLSLKQPLLGLLMALKFKVPSIYGEDEEAEEAEKTEKAKKAEYSFYSLLFPESPFSDNPAHQGGDEEARAAIYPANQILAVPMRQVVDFWLGCWRLLKTRGTFGFLDKKPEDIKPDAVKPATPEEVIEKAATDWERKICAFAARKVREAGAEDLRLSADERKQVENVVVKNPADNRWEFQSDNIVCRTVIGPALEIDGLGFSGLHGTLHLRRLLRWEMWPASAQSNGDGRPPILDGPTSAALMFCHDIIRLSKDGVVLSEMVDQNMTKRTTMVWRLGDLTLTVPWYLSVWDTFRSFSIFADFWNRIKAKVRDFRTNAGWMDDFDLAWYAALGWVAAGICTFLHPSCPKELLKLATQDFNEIKKAKPNLKLEEVTKSIVEETQKLWKLYIKCRDAHADTHQVRELREWFVAVLCLLTPECGVLECAPPGRGGEKIAPSGVSHWIRDMRKIFEEDRYQAGLIRRRVREERRKRLTLNIAGEPDGKNASEMERRFYRLRKTVHQAELIEFIDQVETQQEQDTNSQKKWKLTASSDKQSLGFAKKELARDFKYPTSKEELQDSSPTSKIGEAFKKWYQERYEKEKENTSSEPQPNPGQVG